MKTCIKCGDLNGKRGGRFVRQPVLLKTSRKRCVSQDADTMTRLWFAAKGQV